MVHSVFRTDQPTWTNPHIVRSIINDLSYICRLVMVNKMAMLLSVSSRIGLYTLTQGYTKPGLLSFVP